MARAAVKAQVSEVRIAKPELHEGARQVILQSAKYNHLAAGRGWNKTTLATWLALDYGISQGMWFLWTAPVSRHLTLGWQNCNWGARYAESSGHMVWNKTEMAGYCANGGRIEFASLEEPDNVRGKSPDVILVDEAGMVQRPEAYYEVLRPMAMHRPDIIFWLIGTPKPGWFVDEFQKAAIDHERMGDSSLYRAWQIPTLGCEISEDGQRLIRKPHPLENPFVPFSQLETDFASMSERSFRQEILAEFIEDGIGIYSRVDKCVRSRETQNEPYNSNFSYQMGVDYARKRDYAVLTVTRIPDMRQVYFERFNQMEWTQLYDRTAGVAAQYHAPVVIETGTMAGDIHVTELRRRGLGVIPYMMSMKSKADLIEHDVAIFERAPHAFLMDIPQQTREYKAFQYETTDAGNLRMGAPKGEGHFDDTVIAGALSRHRLRWPFQGTTSGIQAFSWGESTFSSIAPGGW